MEQPLTTLQDGTIAQASLYMAIELSNTKWRVGFSDGRHNARQVTVMAGDRGELLAAMTKAKAQFKLAAAAKVESCYEAGRDGFWLHRFLVERGIANRVVDAASMEVQRRARRAKTDRLDLDKLLSALVRECAGEARVWRVVRVPSVAEEDARRVHREVERLKCERTAHGNRIQSLLVLHNVRIKHVGGRRLAKWLLDQDGVLPAQLYAEIRREAERLQLVEAQLRALGAQRKAELAAQADRQILGLAQLRAIGPDSAWVLVRELFGWRKFSNRREVGSAAGLTGCPWASGELQREQGISKAGNRRVRWLMIELAWAWRRYQPESALTQWFETRFGAGGARTRRVGIVALARRLLIALWRYLEDGVIPEGAQLKRA
jgi:transposase